MSSEDTQEITIEGYDFISLVPSSRQAGDVILYLSEKELQLLTKAYERYAKNKLAQHRCYVKRTEAMGKRPKPKDTTKLKLKLRVDEQSLEELTAE